MNFKLLSKKEAAALMTVAVATFDRLRKREGFPTPVRLGHTLRWRDTDIDAWIAASYNNPKPTC